MILTLYLATFWDYFRLGENKTPLALFITIAFGFSVAGLIIGFQDLRNIYSKRGIIGMVGHIFIIIFFFALAIYGLTL